jgi:predicted RNase H-like HicB family nuclease
MKDYHVNVFSSDEDEGYIADIPDLRHCSAFGATPQEALAEVLKAKEAWIKAAKAAREWDDNKSAEPTTDSYGRARKLT